VAAWLERPRSACVRRCLAAVRRQPSNRCDRFTGIWPVSIGNWPVNYRLLQPAVGVSCSRKHGEVTASSHPEIREDKSVRNVAFSILLSALALLQIAVVSAALSRPTVQGATGGTTEVDARPVLAAAEAKRKAPVL
jgi:hypothetical protein